MKMLFLSLFFCFTLQSQTVFYVSPSGSDSNDGSFGKPFATLQRAQKAVLKASKQQPVHVYLRGGIYYLPETFVVNADGSGTAEGPVVYQSYKEERPVISGGRRLSLKWEPYRDGILKARVPSGTISDQLFVNGERQQMARYPNYDPKAKYFDGFAADAFSPERAAHWGNPKGGYIHAMHPGLWGDFHYLITGKVSGDSVTYIGGWQNNRKKNMHKSIRFVENIFEELDAPGEWFLDASARTLYLYPPKGTDMNTALIEVVSLRHLIELNGSETRPVQFVSFKGITFRHTARTFMDNKEPLLRSDWTTYRGGAIFLTGTGHCSVEDCFLDQLGGNAIFVNNYNRYFAVRGCHLANIGGNGIAFIGDPKAVRSPLFEYNEVNKLENIDRTPGPKTNNYPAECVVDNCLIYRTGRFEKQTAPVQIDMAQDITVSNCSIYDVPRAGINIGDGCWGGHVIEYCDIFETVKETGDHGSFNSWGRDRFWCPSTEEINQWVMQVPELPLLDVVKPNVLRNNRWRCDHGWDIDLDDGSSNYLIYNNLCLNGGIKNREGFHRIVENNIMVNNNFHPHCWLKNSGDVFRRNIVWQAYAPARMSPEPWGKEMDYNFVQVYGKPTESAVMLQKLSNRDEHSLEGDALFVGPEHGDYRVKEGSPVLTLGFKNFPMDQFGVKKPELKAMARTPELPAPGYRTAGYARDIAPKNWRGVTVRNIINEGEMSSYGLPDLSGALVTVLDSAHLMAQAGLHVNDVLLYVDGKKIDAVSDLMGISFRNGRNCLLKVLRNQKEIEIQFTE